MMLDHCEARIFVWIVIWPFENYAVKIRNIGAKNWQWKNLDSFM